jgi:hypothetical protein
MNLFKDWDNSLHDGIDFSRQVTWSRVRYRVKKRLKPPGVNRLGPHGGASGRDWHKFGTLSAANLCSNTFE